jgi:predicted nucleotidyltransferase
MKIGHLDVPDQALIEYCRRNQIRELSVFGSVQRDDFRPDSDVDILVEFEEDAEIGFLALSRIRRELSAIIGRDVDLVPKDGLKTFIRQSVLDSSEIIYAA